MTPSMSPHAGPPSGCGPSSTSHYAMEYNSRAQPTLWVAHPSAVLLKAEAAPRDCSVQNEQRKRAIGEEAGVHDDALGTRDQDRRRRSG